MIMMMRMRRKKRGRNSFETLLSRQSDFQLSFLFYAQTSIQTSMMCSTLTVSLLLFPLLDARRANLSPVRWHTVLTEGCAKRTPSVSVDRRDSRSQWHLCVCFMRIVLPLLWSHTPCIGCHMRASLLPRTRCLAIKTFSPHSINCLIFAISASARGIPLRIAVREWEDFSEEVALASSGSGYIEIGEWNRLSSSSVVCRTREGATISWRRNQFTSGKQNHYRFSPWDDKWKQRTQ